MRRLPGARARLIDADALTTLAQACRDDERLRFDYAARARGQASTVEPHRLVSLDHRWYLVAYDLIRHDWRTFRLDRTTGAGTPGPVPPA